VADAKAFRLSRTALNPKDYKIAALSGWKRKANADYACLIGSFFPKGTSRVYQEAVAHNVTLLSYTHLLFVLSADNWKSIDLKPLWELNNSLSQVKRVDAKVYWKTLNKWFQHNVKSKVKWEKIQSDYSANIREQGKQQINYWKEQKAKVKSMNKEEMARQLLIHMGVDGKIAQIRKRIEQLSHTESLLGYL
jgi:type II restriction enzyme